MKYSFLTFICLTFSTQVLAISFYANTFKPAASGQTYELNSVDCDSLDDPTALESHIYDMKDFQDHLNCRSVILTNSFDKKSYCECVKSSLVKPLSKEFFENLKPNLEANAMVDQSSDYASVYVDLRNDMKKVIKQSSFFSFTDVPDRSIFCSKEDLSIIIKKAKAGQIGQCSEEKLTGFFSNLSTNALVYFSDNKKIAPLLKSAPNSYSSFTSQMDETISNDGLRQEALQSMVNSFIEMMRDPSKIQIEEGHLAFINESFSMDPLFSKLKITLPNGMQINPEGQYDITKYLNFDPTLFPEVMDYMAQEAIAKAVKAERIDFGHDAYALREDCDHIKKSLELICGEANSLDNYIRETITTDPQIIVQSIPESQKNDTIDDVLMGAVQCYFGGYGKGMTDQNGDDFARENLSALFNFNQSSIGSFLKDPQYYSKGMQSNSLIISANSQAAMQSKIEQAAEDEAKEQAYAAKLTASATRDSSGSFRLDTSVLKGWGGSKAVQPRTPASPAATFSSSLAEEKVAQPTASTTIGNQMTEIAASIPQMPKLANTYERRDSSQAAASKKVTAQDAAAPSSLPSFEERLARIFEQKKESDQPTKNSESSTRRRSSDYRLQQSQEQIDQLKKELSELKTAKTASAPIASQANSQTVTQLPNRSSNFKGLESSASNNGPTATPSYSAPAPRAGAPSSSGAQVSSSSGGGSSASSAQTTAYEASANKISGFSASKGGSSGSGFTLSKEDVGGGDKVIIPASSFNADDTEYLKKLFEQTKGEPIYLSQTDAEGREKYVMLEAVVKADGSIEYVPVDQNEKVAVGTKGETKPKYSGRGAATRKEESKKRRTKVEDLKSLLGEKL